MQLVPHVQNKMISSYLLLKAANMHARNMQDVHNSSADLVTQDIIA